MEHSPSFQLTQQAAKKLYESVDNTESLNQWKTQMISLIEEISRFKLSSSTELTQISNTSLDPTDWFTARQMAHQILDSSIDYMQTLRNNPVYPQIPVDVRTSIEQESLPEYGQPLSNVCHEVFTSVLPYNRYNSHPRFWG